MKPVGGAGMPAGMPGKTCFLTETKTLILFNIILTNELIES